MKQILIRYRCDECSHEHRLMMSVKTPGVLPNWPELRCSSCDGFPLMHRYPAESQEAPQIVVPQMAVGGSR